MARIHSMARHGRVEDLRQLIADGVNINAIGIRGKTPLYLASDAGHAAAAKTLLEAGADPNQLIPDGEPPLYVAAKHGWEDVVELLLAAGANPNVRGFFGPVAVAAAMANRSKIVDLLAARGADLDAAGHEGMSANEWLAVGGVFERNKRKHPWPKCETNADGDELASNQDEEFVRRMMDEGLSPAEYMAKHGRFIYVWGGARRIYSDPELNNWAHQAADIVFDADRMAEVEEQYLTGEDLEDARRHRRSLERFRRRHRSHLSKSTPCTE